MTQAGALGFDKTKVVLMGHSAGAHLSALVGTDMTYLKKAGLNSKSLRGIIPLDGACYDVPKQIAGGGDMMHDTYLRHSAMSRLGSYLFLPPIMPAHRILQRSSFSTFRESMEPSNPALSVML